MTHSFEPTFPERELAVVERAFERLLASGDIAAEPATADDLRIASLPVDAPEYLRLARRFRAIRLVLAEITFDLHRGRPIEGDDGPGVWSIASDSPELDIRLGHADRPDAVLDLTWSPKAEAEVIFHSTILHFIVRSAAGDRA